MLGRRRRIWGSKCGGEVMILGMFQSPLPLQIRSETNRSWSLSVAGPIGVLGCSVLSQGSFHTLVSSPLPMTLPRLVINRYLPARMPLHPCDIVFVSWTWRNWAEPQYFPFKTHASKQSGLVMIRHACFARRAVLKAWMSRMPRPPSTFGLVSLLQATMHIFFFSREESHQIWSK